MFSLKGQRVNIFAFMGHLLSIASTQLCLLEGKWPCKIHKQMGVALAPCLPRIHIQARGHRIISSLSVFGIPPHSSQFFSKHRFDNPSFFPSFLPFFFYQGPDIGWSGVQQETKWMSLSGSHSLCHTSMKQAIRAVHDQTGALELIQGKG